MRIQNDMKFSILSGPSALVLMIPLMKMFF